MYVVATAGHVDHGKSALVRRLTGMEPDRWAEERRRGMTIDLGFAWTQLPTGEDVAFVDVPGHERFITNMLAGVGSVPAVMVVVAADEGWMRQTAEHVAVIDALGVEHGLLVVTKSDLADPQLVIDDARERLAATSLRGCDAVAVSSVTGEGIDELVTALGALSASLPAPDLDAPVRLWVDRAFTIQGAGTVVTGTLPAGRVRVGDRLTITGAGDPVVVRGVQSRGTTCAEVAATARVALNLRGVDCDDVGRGTALVTPGQWRAVDEVDVIVDGDPGAQLVAHIGSAGVPTRVRRLSDGAARLRLAHPLPLRENDVLLLREPSSRTIWRARVADVSPEVLHRRGDGQLVATALAAGGRWRRPEPAEPPRPVAPPDVDVTQLQPLLDRLSTSPLAAPDQDELRELDRAALAHASRVGFVLDLGGGIYVSPDAPKIAVERLHALPQPFTVSAAREALDSTRRVVVPLLEHLDAARITRRLPDGTRILVTRRG